jgi:hypothetical protein
MQPVSKVITVVTAGTPVRLSTDTTLRVVGLFIKAAPGNTGGTIYVGSTATFPKDASADGLVADVNGGSASFALNCEDGTERLKPCEYWVDVATSGDKVLVTWFV